jgi:exodeoxyribonuclease VII large subunit
VRSRPVLAAPARDIERRQEQVEALVLRARRCLASRLDRAGDDVAHTRARLLALSPASTLRRGYAIVQRGDGTVVRAAAEVSDGEEVSIRFAADQLTATAHQPGGSPG